MKEDTTDLLIQRLLDGDLSDSERRELNDMLRSSPEARDHYRRALTIHSALIRRDESSLPDFVVKDAPTRRTTKFPKRILYAIAALIILSLSIGIIDLIAIRRVLPKAEILSTKHAVWPAGVRPMLPGKMPRQRPIELISGQFELGYPSGARVVLEGPCRFSLDAKESLTVLHGRASVHAPEGAEGFSLHTPAGQIIDRGTEFGVAVGSDGNQAVVLTEVFKGEIELNTATTDSLRLTDGQSRVIVDDGSILNELDESPVFLSNALHRSAEDKTNSPDNLAFGKPVMSAGYCTRPHGSVFPPDNLTDGRLNDSGVPGDWSFWLAPDGESGEFTVDLLHLETVSRVSLQNTSNRAIDDRGVEKFILLGSEDNRTFTPLTEGGLPRIDPSEFGQSFPFFDFRFEPTKLRYLKCVVVSHYRHLARPENHPCQGGGLNEIRVFAK